MVRATRPRIDAGVKVPMKCTVTLVPGRGLELHSTSTPLVEMLTSVETVSPGEIRMPSI